MHLTMARNNNNNLQVKQTKNLFRLSLFVVMSTHKRRAHIHTHNKFTNIIFYRFIMLLKRLLNSISLSLSPLSEFSSLFLPVSIGSARDSPSFSYIKRSSSFYFKFYSFCAHHCFTLLLPLGVFMCLHFSFFCIMVVERAKDCMHM
jgi:hypothetical protein